MNLTRSLRWLSVVALATLAACSGTSGGSDEGIGDGEIPGTGHGSSGGAEYADGAAAPTAGPATGKSSGSSSGSGGIATGSSGDDGGDDAASGGQGVSAGLLTAGAWDDNRNFDFFQSYRQTAKSVEGAPPFSEDEITSAHARFGQSAPPRQTLDVSLVLDTTGSMGDEIAYLNAEFLALHARIEAAYPNADQRWSVVFYKDKNDSYVVKWYDFRSDPNEFIANFQGITADGGDDYPESPERALAVDAQLGWRDDDTAKLAFWITDAPHHAEDAGAMADAVRALAGRGVHVYPVAASGADDLTQLTMREAAELTGGRYLFLTDDSGIGDPHAVPLIPCYFVTKLDAAIERMVDIELSGAYREPTAAEVIREGGDPQSGACHLSTGQTVLVF